MTISLTCNATVQQVCHLPTSRKHETITIVILTTMDYYWQAVGPRVLTVPLINVLAKLISKKKTYYINCIGIPNFTAWCDTAAKLCDLRNHCKKKSAGKFSVNFQWHWMSIYKVLRSPKQSKEISRSKNVNLLGCSPGGRLITFWEKVMGHVWEINVKCITMWVWKDTMETET